MSVWRTKPLPEGDLEGDVIVAEVVVRVTNERIAQYAEVEGGQEAMVFWAGRRMNNVVVYTSVVEPTAEHSFGRVWASAKSVGRAAKAARANRLGILAQIHSHPGDDTRHSDGDDEMILLPFEGMLSIVIPNYGAGHPGIERWSFHQHQRGQWVRCTPKSVAKSLHVVPAFLDARFQDD